MKSWCAGPYLPRTFPEESSTKGLPGGPPAGYFRVNSNLFYGGWTRRGLEREEDEGERRERGMGRAGRYRGIISFIHLRDLRILRIKYAEAVSLEGHRASYSRAHGRFLVITPVNCRGRPRSRRLLLAGHSPIRRVPRGTTVDAREVLKECLRGTARARGVPPRVLKYNRTYAP